MTPLRLARLSHGVLRRIAIPASITNARQIRRVSTSAAVAAVAAGPRFSQNEPVILLPLLAAAAAGFGLNVACEAPVRVVDESDAADSTGAEALELVNWSGTHSVSTERYFQPETVEDLKRIVDEAHANGEKLRPVGSALSPNGLGFQPEGMVNLALMDSILNVDTKNMQVTVQAGARVSQVVEALRPHGLTLANYASITEQQIGGFIQVGAHGTGAAIPPVDEQVVSLKLITPAVGELELSRDDEDPGLFELARTSLGLLGVVAEVTLQCVPAHMLEETTSVRSRREVREKHTEWMHSNKHLRYMWIPHTDDVVVVTCNPVDSSSGSLDGNVATTSPESFSTAQRLGPARDLLQSHPHCKLAKKDVDELSFTALRDELLALDPLNVDWVRKVNKSEAEFWRRSQGTRVDWSDCVLQFDCGGQQWVAEVAFPVPDNKEMLVDVQFVEDVLMLIERNAIPAPSPIEQRWSAPSRSPMSPANEKLTKEVAPLYSWVGIIMYLPDASASGPKSAETRSAISDAFKQYKQACEQTLWPGVHAVEHWAKIEMPTNVDDMARLQTRMGNKYPLEAFNVLRQLFDPKEILCNPLMQVVMNSPYATPQQLPQDAPAGVAIGDANQTYERASAVA